MDGTEFYPFSIIKREAIEQNGSVGLSLSDAIVRFNNFVAVTIWRVKKDNPYVDLFESLNKLDLNISVWWGWSDCEGYALDNEAGVLEIAEIYNVKNINLRKTGYFSKMSYIADRYRAKRDRRAEANDEQPF